MAPCSTSSQGRSGVRSGLPAHTNSTVAPLTSFSSLRHGIPWITTPREAVTGNNHISLQMGEVIQRVDRLIMVVAISPQATGASLLWQKTATSWPSRKRSAEPL